MIAFIVRPFGTKQEVNFDKVEAELIQPALAKAGVKGGTTATILEQGNIREDMFAQLLLADLVIADVSIHNANVFYELGIRHALRDKRTFLIRCSKDEIPFDLKTDRYLSYPVDNPADALEALVAGINATLLSEKVDSPVFYMLPKLVVQDPERFLAVPPDFGEEVELARASKQAGKLSLLAFEAEGFPWEMPALRAIAEALFQLKDFEAAVTNWEKVRERFPNDLSANDRLATIFQRQAEVLMLTDEESGIELLAKSDIAIERLLKNADKLSNDKKAEVYSLKGRNSKVRWMATWKNASETEWRKKALQSTYLIDAYEQYEHAYNQDLNHFYSGINALGLLSVIISLGEALPDVWSVEYETDEDAADALSKHKSRFQKLSTLVQASIEAERKRTPPAGKPDVWLNMTEADLACLTLSKPARVSGLYQKVIQEANDMNFDSARRQLLIYKQLGVQKDNVEAALGAFSEAKIFEELSKPYYLLFTGHMIDRTDRKEPRFPAIKELEVKAAIKDAVQKEKDKYGAVLKGISGGACGGDILFHEVCAELGIHTELHLALPREQFVVASVEHAGASWVERFDALYTKLPVKILFPNKELPKWLEKKHNEDYIWQRNNLWMLNSGLVCGGMQMTLFALWDGKGGDGEGGTEHMVNIAEARGSKVIIIDIDKIGSN